MAELGRYLEVETPALATFKCRTLFMQLTNMFAAIIPDVTNMLDIHLTTYPVVIISTEYESLHLLHLGRQSST